MATISNGQQTFGFAPRKETTPGSKLMAIVGRGYDEFGMMLPKVSQNGNNYYTLVFADQCRFHLTEAAINYLTSPTLQDGNVNPDYLPMGIYPGMKFMADREPNGRPVLRYIED